MGTRVTRRSGVGYVDGYGIIRGDVTILPEKNVYPEEVLPTPEDQRLVARGWVDAK